ncbi:hypothetical protein [Nocardia salmonicida]|uniref:hypothetical protein n=1 Tax=Nocardia salmonicida TaxID=53431 RepID=UPI000AF15060|nr:hypothetical protein [Nocardia salmonicida]
MPTELLLLLIPAIAYWRRDSVLIRIIPTVTASLHPDPKRRRDALRALDRIGKRGMGS